MWGVASNPFETLSNKVEIEKQVLIKLESIEIELKKLREEIEENETLFSWLRKKWHSL